MRSALPSAAALLLAAACTAVPAGERATGAAPRPGPSAAASTTPVAAAFAPRAVTMAPGEGRLANVRQLTDGGENAEAYFSADGTRLIFQSTRDGRACDDPNWMRSSSA